MASFRSPARVIVTLIIVAVAALMAWTAWRYYMVAPWTRDGRVRAETVTVAAEVPGRVTEMRVTDNQFVHKGDVLFVIDPDRFRLAVEHADANVLAAKARMEVAKARAQRRRNLNALSVSEEERQQAEGDEDAAKSAYALAQADARLAALDLAKTTVRAPVNGYVTNLRLRSGSYVATGARAVTIIDSDSFWVVGYFEETKLKNIRSGDRAIIRLMGESGDITGRVNSLSHGIADKNDTADAGGLAAVEPTFTWVRLAQRIPVRIDLDKLPEGLHIAAGQTCTIVLERDKGAKAAEKKTE